MSWRPTEYEDLHRIVLNDDPSDADLRCLPDNEDSREYLRNNVMTWDEEGVLLAIVGVQEKWKGVAEVFTLFTDSARQRGLGLTRFTLRILDQLHRERGYWRIQATVAEDDEVARRWIVHLGFEFEGTMYAYGPDGRTYDLYARVRE